MSNLLTDALHCASLSVTQGLVMHQRYARGVVVGLLACLTHQSGDFEVAQNIVRDISPKPCPAPTLAEYDLRKKINVAEIHTLCEKINLG